MYRTYYGKGGHSLAKVSNPLDALDCSGLFKFIFAGDAVGYSHSPNCVEGLLCSGCRRSRTTRSLAGVGKEASVGFLATLSCAGEPAYQQPQEARYAVGGLRPGRA